MAMAMAAPAGNLVEVGDLPVAVQVPGEPDLSDSEIISSHRRSVASMAFLSHNHAMNTKIIQAIRRTGKIADLWLPRKLAYDKTPGMSVGLVYKGRLIYQKGFGFADIKSRKKADAATLYRVASHSKMFTAAAVMKLVEQGKIRLDDKISDYLGWFKVKAGRKDAVLITIRQLLSHTAGVFRDSKDPIWTTGKFPKELKASIHDSPLLRESLTGFKYTNYGYALLGALIESVSGQTYAQYIERTILQPLGMKNTRTDYETNTENIATGYGVDFPDSKRIIFTHNRTNAYAPATGFISNVTDMAKFISEFSLSGSRKGILRADSKRQMMYASADSGIGHYGLGLIIDKVEGKNIIGHSGGYNGYITRTIFDPRAEIAVIVFTNSLRSNAEGIAFGLLEMIYALMEEKGSNADFSRYEGVFRDSWGDEIIVVKDGRLISFDPEANFPFRSKFFLIPDRKAAHFTVSTEDTYSLDGERAVFMELKRGKYQRLSLPGNISRRIG